MSRGPTMTRFDEIRARLRKATPGPWHPNPDGTGEEGDGCVWFEDANLGRVDVICGTAFWNKADADLIAHAPSDLAYLLEIIDALTDPGCRKMHADDIMQVDKS